MPVLLLWASWECISLLDTKLITGVWPLTDVISLQKRPADSPTKKPAAKVRDYLLVDVLTQVPIQ